MSESQKRVKLLKQGNPNSTWFVLGATGSGKSTLMANLLLDEQRFVIFDTRNEYDPTFFHVDGKADVVVVSSRDEFRAALNNLAPRIISKNFSDSQLEADLNNLYEFQKINAHIEELAPVRVSIDELNRFCDSSSCPEPLREITQRGRDYKINKLFGAQWFGTIPTWMRDSFSEIYTFRHSDPRGLALLELYGFNKEQVRELPRYHCLHNGKDGIETIELVA